MYNEDKDILNIPDSVKEDTLSYRSHVEKFLKGDTSPAMFRAYRVPMGVYEQRSAGKYMVRIRIGAGLVLFAQMDKIAQLSKTCGNGIVHVTTRQDIQIHEVNIENTPDVIEGLLEAGLSSRGGGGNTVRNVTSCSLAGICPKEEFDVAPYAIAVAEYLLHDKSSFNLPRKYKIAFSGCRDDCAYASIADLGFFAHLKNGVKGFSVYAAGGLGPNPALAVKIEDFIKTDEIFDVAEAVKRLFDKHGDRANKHKARLRYVLARLGAEEFVKLYKQERQILKSEDIPYQKPEIRNIISKHSIPKESITVRLQLKDGDIPADDLIEVSRIAAAYGHGPVRTTQLQNILITGIAKENAGKVNKELQKLSIDVFAEGRPKVVTCTGASTCKLGICLSRGLAGAISNKLAGKITQQPEDAIRISGCPNSCGQHHIAGIGFQGRAKRVNSRMMPFYDVLINGRTCEGDAKLATEIGTVPAKIIPDLLAESVRNGGIDIARLKELVVQHEKSFAGEYAEDYFYDYGTEEPFSLAGRGPGECGAGVMDVIKLDLNEAKDVLEQTQIDSGQIYKALLAAARALLVTFGMEPKKDREIFTAFSKHLIEPGWVETGTQKLLDEAIDWRIGDRDSIDDLLPQVKDLTKRIEELFLSLDANLNFKIEPVKQNSSKEQPEKKTHSINLRGVACPLNFVKAKLELEKINVGEVLEILLDEGEPARNVPASFIGQGQEVIEVNNKSEYSLVKVRRMK